MSTLTNGIATESEAKAKVIGPREEEIIVDNRACTKKRLINIGGKVDGYTDNQLVKYSDIKQGFIINVFNRTNLNAIQEKFYFNCTFDRDDQDYIIINGKRNSFQGMGNAGLYLGSVSNALMFTQSGGDVASLRLSIASSYINCYIGIGTVSQPPSAYDLEFSIEYAGRSYDLLRSICRRDSSGFNILNTWYNINKGLG